MTLTTRTITNAGAPLYATDGTILANATITFALVDHIGMRSDAWDAVTGERVGGDPILATTDASGEFTVALWPNSRGATATRYLCTVNRAGFRPFYGVVEDAAQPLPWVSFMASGSPLTPQEISQLKRYLDEIEAAKLEAEAARDAAEDAAQAAIDLLGSTVEGVHAHAITDVTGLQPALDGKEASGTAAAAIATHEAAPDPHTQYTTAAEAAAAAPVQSVAGKTGAVTLAKGDVGLGNVDNTSDAAKPVSTATQAALDGKAAAVHTHSVATTLADGFLSAADKTKLDSIAAGATAYTHPTNHPASIITQDANNRFVTDAEKATWNGKQDALTSGVSIKTVNGASLLGSGDVAVGGSPEAIATHEAAPDPHPQYTTTAEAAAAAPVQSVAAKTGAVTLVKADVGLGNVDNTSDANKPVSTAQQAALDAKAPIASPTFTGTVSGITKAMVGLGNVDNTSDANKPVSTAQQIALDGKENTGTAAAAVSAHTAAADPHPQYTTAAEAAAAAPVQSVAGKTGAVTLAKADVGLSNVDNTSDANKPVSTAQQIALNGKENTGTAAAAVAAHEAASDPHPQYQVDLVSGENIKTINGQSILGAGNIEIRGGAGAALKHLLVYYGYPVAFKGIWDAAAVAAEIAANYDYWVVGDTYQDPAHEEYASTVSIVNAVRAAGCKVYGYVPIGLSTSALTLAQMQARVDQWAAIGVDGIFLDEFGFDYANTRTRQKDIVDYVHSKGLPYCANAWTAEDFMCDNVSELPWPSNDWRYANFVAGNPTNLVLPRTPADCYLIENFGFSNTGPANVFDMQERCELTMALAASKNVSVWGLAVLPETAPGVLDAALLGHLTTLENVGAYISANAYLYDIVVVGSGGFSFGSNGTPLLAPLQALPEYAGAPLSAAFNNYTTMTAVRQFGDVQILVTNTASVQSVSVSSPSTAVLSGEYPGQGQTVIVSPTAPANPVLNQLWVQT